MINIMKTKVYFKLIVELNNFKLYLMKGVIVLYTIVCNVCGKTVQVGSRRYKNCHDCSQLSTRQKEEKKKILSQKTDWKKIIELSKETGLSYGKLVQRGLL